MPTAETLTRTLDARLDALRSLDVWPYLPPDVQAECLRRMAVGTVRYQQTEVDTDQEWWQEAIDQLNYCAIEAAQTRGMDRDEAREARWSARERAAAELLGARLPEAPADGVPRRIAITDEGRLGQVDTSSLNPDGTGFVEWVQGLPEGNSPEATGQEGAQTPPSGS